MTKIYEAENHLFLCTGYDAPAEHSHMAAHIIISLTDEMKIVSQGEEYQCRGILIPSGVSHRVHTDGNAVLVFLYDSTTNVAKAISSIRPMAEADCADIIRAYFEFENNHAETGEYWKFEACVLHKLGLTKTRNTVSDERIQNAMEYVKHRLAEPVTSKAVADHVYLSQGRFSHLFREQAGMTFASYLVYQRIMYVYGEILRGRTITEAAVDGGFSSASHFADVNRRIFGITASAITRDLVFTKVS